MVFTSILITFSWEIIRGSFLQYPCPIVSFVKIMSIVIYSHCYQKKMSQQSQGTADVSQTLVSSLPSSEETLQTFIGVILILYKCVVEIKTL